MPCRILHESSVGGGVIYEIRMGQVGYWLADRCSDGLE